MMPRPKRTTEERIDTLHSRIDTMSKTIDSLHTIVVEITPIVKENAILRRQVAQLTLERDHERGNHEDLENESRGKILELAAIIRDQEERLDKLKKIALTEVERNKALAAALKAVL